MKLQLSDWECSLSITVHAKISQGTTTKDTSGCKTHTSLTHRPETPNQHTLNVLELNDQIYTLVSSICSTVLLAFVQQRVNPGLWESFVQQRWFPHIAGIQ